MEAWQHSAVGGAIGAIVYALERLESKQVAWPDSVHYAMMGTGRVSPAPYWRRWLLPTILKDDSRLWQWSNGLSVSVMCATVAYESTDWRAALLLALLPGVAWICARCPILVDAPAMAMATVTCALLAHGYWSLAIISSLICGSMKEGAPVFASLYSLNPLPLIGLAAVRWRGQGHTDPNDPWCDTSWSRLSKLVRDTRPFDWRNVYTLKAFGAVSVLAVLGARMDMLTAACAVTLTVALAQGLIAHDRTRLTMWAAPILVMLAMRAPSEAISVGCVLHLATPRVV